MYMTVYQTQIPILQHHLIMEVVAAMIVLSHQEAVVAPEVMVEEAEAVVVAQ